MARLQRASAALCAALLLSACGVDGAGLWGSILKGEEAKPAAQAQAQPAALAALSAAVPAGDGHNVYWCARPQPRERAGAGARV